MNRATLIVRRARARVDEIIAAVPMCNPDPQYWLISDAGEDYCRRCVIAARGQEFELGPLLVESDYSFQRDDWEEAYFDGIDGGRDVPGEGTSHCTRCGEKLSYLLTDYGAESEALYWLEAPVAVISPDVSYDLYRLTLNLFSGMDRSRRLLMIAAAVGQTYRLFKATRP